MRDDSEKENGLNFGEGYDPGTHAVNRINRGPPVLHPARGDLTVWNLRIWKGHANRNLRTTSESPESRQAVDFSRAIAVLAKRHDLPGSG